MVEPAESAAKTDIPEKGDPVSSSRWRWFNMLLGGAVSLIALWLLLRRDFGDIQDELRHAQYWAVVPCLILLALGLWVRSIRWRVLLPGRLTAAHSFHILNVSYFINGVLPLRVGELARAALVTRLDPPVPVLTSLSTILVERLLDTLMVFALIGIALALLPTGFEVGLLGLLLGVGAVVGMIVLGVMAAKPHWAHVLLDGIGRFARMIQRPALHDRLHQWLDQLLDGIAPLASGRASALAVFWTVVGWSFSVIAGYLLMFAIFDEPLWSAALAMIALASFAVAVPAVPGNLGPFEAAVVFGLASANQVADMTAAPAVAFALLLHVVNLGLYIGLGLIGLWFENVNLAELMQTARRIGAQPPAEADQEEAGA